MASTKKKNNSPKEEKRAKKSKDTSKGIIVSQSPQNSPTGIIPDDESRIKFENDLKKIQTLGFIKDSRGMGIQVPSGISPDNDIQQKTDGYSYDKETSKIDITEGNVDKEPIDESAIELARVLDNITQDGIILLNKEGKSLYECIGITPEETDELMVSVKTIMRQSIRKANKVEELANNCLNNHKLLCLLLWLEVK